MLLPFVLLTAAMAQGPGGRRTAQNFTDLKAYLSLTDAQITQIQQSNQQTMTNLASVRTQIATERSALKTLLNQANPDPAAVGKLEVELASLRKQVEQARTTARAQALSYLTADQKTKLNALVEAAKLMPDIMEATRLNLLAPPAGGPGFGPGGMGPGMMGHGMMGPAGGGPRRARGQQPPAPEQQ